MEYISMEWHAARGGIHRPDVKLPERGFCGTNRRNKCVFWHCHCSNWFWEFRSIGLEAHSINSFNISCNSSGTKRSQWLFRRSLQKSRASDKKLMLDRGVMGELWWNQCNDGSFRSLYKTIRSSNGCKVKAFPPLRIWSVFLNISWDRSSSRIISGCVGFACSNPWVQPSIREEGLFLTSIGQPSSLIQGH